MPEICSALASSQTEVGSFTPKTIELSVQIHRFGLKIAGAHFMRKAEGKKQLVVKHRQGAHLEVTDLGFSGPGSHSALQMFCVEVSCLFCSTCVKISGQCPQAGRSSGVGFGIQAQNPRSFAMKNTTWHCPTAAQRTPKRGGCKIGGVAKPHKESPPHTQKTASDPPHLSTFCSRLPFLQCQHEKLPTDRNYLDN